MRKVLIADGTEGFRDQLCEILAAKYEIICAADGTQAWEWFLRLQPDLLVLDLELPEIDGITLLRRIKNAGFHPAVMVLARLVSDYTVDTLIQMKVDYLLRKPCKANSAAERAEELLRYHTVEEAPVRTVIAEMLSELGIPSKLHGCRYLLSAVTFMARNPSQYITKELYPAVGREYGVDGPRVERCIRNAILKGWKNGNCAVWERYFGKNKEGHILKPNNTTFIVRLVELLGTKL